MRNKLPRITTMKTSETEVTQRKADLPSGRMVEGLVDLLAELLVLVRLGLLGIGNIVNHLLYCLTRNTGTFLS
jgi:hypothetical protein